MVVYAIILIKVHDETTYAKYTAGFLPIWQKYEGKVLAGAASVNVLEGEWPHDRTVILEFPNQQKLDAWYKDEEYQELAKHRFAASEAHFVVVEGFSS